jgi:hypothetical protein
MCWRTSHAEGNVLDLFENVGSQVRAQPLGRHQLDPPLQEILQEEGKLHEVVEGLLLRPESHEEIDVALRALLPTDEGSEQADAERADRFPVCLNPSENLLLCRDRNHMGIVTEASSSAPGLPCVTSLQYIITASGEHGSKFRERGHVSRGVRAQSCLQERLPHLCHCSLLPSSSPRLGALPPTLGLLSPTLGALSPTPGTARPTSGLLSPTLGPRPSLFWGAPAHAWARPYPSGDRLAQAWGRAAQTWARAPQAWAKAGTPDIRAANPSVNAPCSGIAPALPMAGMPEKWRKAADARALLAKAWAERLSSERMQNLRDAVELSLVTGRLMFRRDGMAGTKAGR